MWKKEKRGQNNLKMDQITAALAPILVEKAKRKLF